MKPDSNEGPSSESARPETSRDSLDPAGNPAGAEALASFGHKDVLAEEKPALVRGVFRSVAGRYDLMNDLMSAGVHRLWKRRLVAALAPRAGRGLLDLAGGTGDIAFAVAERLELEGGPDAVADIVICDLTPEMLAVGRDRAIDRGLFRGISWVAGDAERLPFPDRSFPAVTMAFGLRNVTERAAALAEIRRVLQPGGRFLCLEFSHVATPLKRAYDFYSFTVLPALGAVIARDVASYRYLAESIRRFPDQPSLAAEFEAAGFSRVRWHDLSGGIAALHVGWRT